MNHKNKSIDEYLIEIKNLANEYFSIADEEDLSAVKRTVHSKLWIELYGYYKKVYKKDYANGYSTFEYFSGTINETIGTCIKNFKPNQGNAFINYINAAVKNEINREKQKEFFHGLKVPIRIKENWTKLSQLAKAKNVSLDDYGKIREIGQVIGMSNADINDAINFYKPKVVNEDYINSDDVKTSIFNNIESSLCNPENELEKQLELNKVCELFETIEKCFAKKQQRVKDYLSALLTCKLYANINQLEIEMNENLNYSFIDRKLMNEFQTIESKKRNCEKIKLPTQQDIAKRFGKDKTDSSRTMKRFLSEVEKEYTGVPAQRIQN